MDQHNGHATTSSSTTQLFRVSQQEVMAEDTSGTSLLIVDSKNQSDRTVLTFYYFLGFSSYFNYIVSCNLQQTISCFFV